MAFIILLYLQVEEKTYHPGAEKQLGFIGDNTNESKSHRWTKLTKSDFKFSSGKKISDVNYLSSNSSVFQRIRSALNW